MAPAPAGGEHGVLKGVGVACGVILTLIVATYVAGVVFFSFHLWPNTSLRGVDVSLQTADELTRTLADMSDGLSVSVSGQGVEFTLSSDDAGLSLNVSDAVQAVTSDVTAWMWPAEMLSEHDESEVLATSFDRAVIEASVNAALAPYNEYASDPVDAYVTYDSQSLSYVINPGSPGSKLDVSAVTDAIVAAVESDVSSVTLTDQQLVKQSRTQDDPSLVSMAQQANAYLSCNVSFLLDGSVMATLGADVIKDWIYFADDGSVGVDDGQIVSWVDELEARIDSVGQTRSYTRPDGKSITVSGGTYGWVTDGDGIESLVRDAVANGTTGDLDIPLKQSAEVYNPGGQEWGSRYIDVDITEQHARMYDSDGTLIWETDIITGATDTGNGTPTGVYTVNNKELNATLIGETDPSTGEPIYETLVTYWMPFVGNAVGLHDATWQPSFGGELYKTGYGSHGCVNLPYDKAAELWDLIQIGDVVITHY